jgi:alpha-1,2-mannosyltransferase
VIEETSLALLQGPSRVSLRRVARVASIAFCCGALPVLVIGVLFVDAIRDSAVATDFRQFYQAAHAILQGQSPYEALDVTAWGGPYPYPPFPAIMTVPLTVLSPQAAGLLVMATLVVVALAVPFVLGVRDWRCFGLILVWPPVIQAIQTANVSLWFALAAALAWRFRERVLPVSMAIGITLATKFFLWPLAVWLAATRKFVAAALSLFVAAVLLVLSWAVIGFAGFLDYPNLLHQLEQTVGDDSYTTYILGLDLGVPSPVSRAVWLALGLSLLVAIVFASRRKDDRSAFVLAIAASLALTPIVWLHYFALLVVVVAVAQRTLGLVWFVPLAMIVTPGSGHATPFEVSVTLAAAALTIALALRAWLAGQPAGSDSDRVPTRALARPR